MTDRGAAEVGEHDWHDAAYVESWVTQRIDGDSGHRARIARLASLVAAAVTVDAPVILDVGAGPGVVADALLRAIPAARLLCQDYSLPMLERARSALAWAGDRVSYHQSDLADPDWSAGLDRPLDAVVSSYAIHNLRDAARIRSVYGDLIGLLGPGGGLFLLDLVESAGPRTDVLYGDRRRHVEDAPASLAVQLGWLVDAGFTEVDCLWKDGFEAAICGFRP